jgi:Tfp pilus assembly protein PilF
MSSPSTLAVALAAVAASSVLLAGCSDDEPARPDDAATASADAGTDAVGTLLQTGLDQLAAGDTAAARGTFRSVLALDGENTYAHYNLGLIAQRAGQDEQAISSYDAALASDPAFAPALFNRGILTEASDLDEAVALYRRAVEADPEFAAAFMRLGFALVHLGETEEGEKALGEGVRLDPSMSNVEAPSYQ